MENELSTFRKEKGIFLLPENPINPKSKIVLKHSQTKTSDIQEFIELNKDLPYEILDQLLMSNDTTPTTLVSPTDPYFPCYINLGYSFFESLILKAKFIFYSDVFINNFDTFILYHELGHTSFHQRHKDNKFSHSYDAEAHSDMFSLYILGGKLSKNVFLEFLDGYIMMRKSSSFSNPSFYCRTFSKYIYHFFKENYDSIKFNISDIDMDTKSYHYVLEFKDYKRLKIDDNNAFKLINELISKSFTNYY